MAAEPEQVPDNYQKGCFESFRDLICSLNPWHKEEVKIPPNCRDIGTLLQNAVFGDIIFIKTKTKLDSAVSVFTHSFIL